MAQSGIGRARERESVTGRTGGRAEVRSVNLDEVISSAGPSLDPSPPPCPLPASLDW